MPSLLKTSGPTTKWCRRRSPQEGCPGTTPDPAYLLSGWPDGNALSCLRLLPLCITERHCPETLYRDKQPRQRAQALGKRALRGTKERRQAKPSLGLEVAADARRPIPFHTPTVTRTDSTHQLSGWHNARHARERGASPVVRVTSASLASREG